MKNREQVTWSFGFGDYDDRAVAEIVSEMPECGCKLSKDVWACKYLDGKFCPKYEQKDGTA